MIDIKSPKSENNSKNDYKELNLEQLEDVSGGRLFDQLKNAAGQQWSESQSDKS